MFIFITGASGAGKTFLIDAFKQLNPNLSMYHFDDVGVPPVEIMIKDYGSPQDWQKAMVYFWVNDLIKRHGLNCAQLVVLEGSFNPDYVIDVCKEFGLNNFVGMLIKADKQVRDERLRLRGSLELINQDMDNWANFLELKATELGWLVIDNNGNKDFAIKAVVDRLYDY